MATILMRRRWRWIGHVTRQEASIAKTAMHWTPEGKRKRGRPKITWRRTVEKEIKEMGKTWEGIKFGKANWIKSIHINVTSPSKSYSKLTGHIQVN